MAKKEMPTGVKLIAVLYYVSAAVGVLLGILFLAAGGLLGSTIPFLAALGVVGGIIFLAFGIVSFFIGRGLWQGKDWARIIAIVFAAIGLLSSLLTIAGSLVGGLIGLILHGAIIWYLMFNKEGKNAFK